MTKEYLRRQFQNFKNVLLDATYATKAELADIDIGDLDLTDYAKKTDLNSYATKSDLANIDVGNLENLTTDDIGVGNEKNIVFDINHLSIGSSLAPYATLENGIYTFNAPIGSVKYARYKIQDKDIEGGIYTVDINVTECTGNWAVQKVYYDTSGTAHMENVYTINKAGEYKVEVDINYETVYNNYRGDGISINVVNAISSTSEVTYTIKIDRYDTFTGSDSELIGKNLTEILNNLSAQITSNSINDNSTMISPTGEEYLMQVTSNGSLVAVPKLPSNILYIGNSLLLGFGNHGMASTTVNDDYYAKINAYLESKGKTLTTARVKGADFENAANDATVNAWLSNTLSEYMSNDRQLVLIQLGDNAGETIEEFRKSCGMLISYVREHCPNARVAWVGMWYSSQTKLDIVTEACNKYGITFIDIRDINKAEYRSTIGATYIDENGNEQTITQDGVANHPNDQGFTAIANRIITTLFE